MKPRSKKLSNNKEICQRKKYNKDNMQKALAAIQQGMSKKLAAKTFQVPRSTLQFRCKNPDKVDPRPGPATVLSKGEEESLVKWVILSSKKGFPKRKEDLQDSVSKFLQESKRANPFKDNVPGEKWMKLFLQRHPELSIRTSEAVTAPSAAVAEKDVKGWFSKIEAYLKEIGLFEILADSTRVFNGDETNFLLCPKTGTVLAERGDKNVYEIDRGQAKSAITVMFTFAASGNLTPPMVIFPYKRLPGDIAAKVPPNWGIGLSDNGWMKADLFYDYVKNVLYPHLQQENVTFPVILFVDGHKTHMTLQVSELCSELQIVLIALYPNSTRILQPADVSAFYPLKCSYRKCVLEWRRENPSQALTKLEFVPILQKAINSAIKPDTIKNGFKACGLYPWDPNSVDYTKCLGTVTTKDSSPKETIANKTITKNKFIDMVGLDTIRELEQKPNQTNCEKALKNLWDFFQNSNTVQRREIENQSIEEPISTQYHEIENLDPNLQIEDLEDEPISTQYHEIENLDPNIQIEDLDVIIANDCSIKSPSQNLIVSNEVTVHNTENSASTSTFQPPVYIQNNDDLDTTNRKLENTPKTPSHQIVVNNIEILTNTDLLTVQAGKATKDNKAEKPQTINNLVPVKLQDLLVLPKTPKRKGTRETERISFVLTSAEWQSKEKEKKRIKQEKEDAVKKRKEERELKKTLPKTKQPKKEKKSKIAKPTSQIQKLVAIRKQLFSPEFYNIPSTSRQTNDIIESAPNSLDLDNNINAEKEKQIYTDAEIEKFLSED